MSSQTMAPNKNSRKSTPPTSSSSSKNVSNNARHSVMLSGSMEQYGSSSDDDFESFHSDVKNQQSVPPLQQFNTSTNVSSSPKTEKSVVSIVRNTFPSSPPQKQPTERAENDQDVLKILMNEYSDDEYNSTSTKGNKQDAGFIENNTIKQVGGYSSEEDEISPFINQQSKKITSTTTVPQDYTTPLSNRQIFDNIQQRDSLSNTGTDTQSQKAIITLTSNEIEEDDNDVLSYSTYNKVNWQTAIFSHFCFRCGIFFTAGIIIGLTIFLSLWFAV